jgi:isoleucyl-tRNA synthetase
MHKSKGNSIAFDEAAEVLGAEVMRYIYVEQKTAQHLNFPDLHPTKTTGPTIDGEARRKLLTFWNCYSFFVMYAEADGWKPGATPLPVTNELDRWVMSRLQRLVSSAHTAFQNYEHFRVIEAFQEFDEQFSNWYLRRSRRRFWDSDPLAYQTLYTVLTTVIRLMAPALPFLTEEIYQNLVRSVEPSAPESVHLTTYPQVDASLIDEQLEHSIDAVIRIKNLALNLRTASKVKIRQPLGTLYVVPRDAADRKVLENSDYVAQILDEANVKSLELRDDSNSLATTRLKPDAKKLTQRGLGRHMKAIAEALDGAGLKEGKYTVEVAGQLLEFAPDDVVPTFEGPANRVCASIDGTFGALDTTLTPELLQEGVARDFNRLVQDLRKTSGLQISDRIVLKFAAHARIADAVEAHAAYLRNELLAERIEHHQSLEGGTRLSLAGEEIAVRLERV